MPLWGTVPITANTCAAFRAFSWPRETHCHRDRVARVTRVKDVVAALLRHGNPLKPPSCRKVQSLLLSLRSTSYGGSTGGPTSRTIWVSGVSTHSGAPVSARRCPSWMKDDLLSWKPSPEFFGASRLQAVQFRQAQLSQVLRGVDLFEEHQKDSYRQIWPA